MQSLLIQLSLLILTFLSFFLSVSFFFCFQTKTGLAHGYRPDMKDAIELLADIWEKTPASLIQHCWQKTELIPATQFPEVVREDPEGTLRSKLKKRNCKAAEEWAEDNSAEVNRESVQR